jgi:hypothetical protein
MTILARPWARVRPHFYSLIAIEASGDWPRALLGGYIPKAGAIGSPQACKSAVRRRGAGYARSNSPSPRVRWCEPPRRSLSCQCMGGVFASSAASPRPSIPINNIDSRPNVSQESPPCRRLRVYGRCVEQAMQICTQRVVNRIESAAVGSGCVVMTLGFKTTRLPI